MVTRRTAIATGLAAAALTCTPGPSAPGPIARGRRQAQSADALLIEENFEWPRQRAALIQAGGGPLPVLEVRLDAPGLVGLKRLLDKSHAIIGISCGATLFCVERIAWDHGFRLTDRSQHCARDPGHEACRQQVAEFLSGTEALTARASSLLVRTYRPSRTDGMLHTWLIRKSVNPRADRGGGDI